MRTNPLHHLLRAAALSAALIAGGAATALADAPGSYFADGGQAAAQASAQNSRAMADAGTLSSATSGRGASNHLPSGAVPARSGS
jgi:hypothetical protein